MDYTDEELKAIRSEYAKDATEEQFTNFIREANQRNLIPGRHLYFQTRKVSEWDAEANGYVRTKRATHLTSIDAFRLIAQRTKEYEGQKPPVYIYFDGATETFRETDVPLPEKQPYAVRVSIFRTGFQQPLTETARFSAYAVYFRKNNEQILSDMWKRRGPEQLSKCGEALALRKAFPEELGGLYISEEMKDDEPQEIKEPVQVNPAAPAQVIPATVTKPEVDHKPAEGKDEPRPHEKKRRGRPPNKTTIAANADVEQAKQNLAETGNVAGLKITDDDLPQFSGGGENGAIGAEGTGTATQPEAAGHKAPPLQAEPPKPVAAISSPTPEKPEPAADPLPTKEERVA